jgi:cysteinyl-tRNA synthetase
MSKSLGNFYTLRDIFAKGHSPEAVRYLLASTPYGKQLNFTFDGLDSAKTAIDRVRNFNDRIDAAKLSFGMEEDLALRTLKAVADFRAAMDDNLNTAEALAAVFEFIREANAALDRGAIHSGNLPGIRALLSLFDSVFDVLKPTESAGGISESDIDALIAARGAAKKSRDFAKSDQIRAQLLEAGVIIEDTKDGVRWKRK